MSQKILLAGNVLYSKDGTFRVPEQKRMFRALFKWTDVELGEENNHLPHAYHRYELWKLDPERLLVHFKHNVIGLCEHTQSNYEKLKTKWGEQEVDRPPWIDSKKEERLKFLEAAREDSTSPFGFCEKCATELERQSELSTSQLLSELLKKYVNEKKYIHPFDLEQRDDEDTVDGKTKSNFIRFSLCLNLANCTVNYEENRKKVEKCLEPPESNCKLPKISMRGETGLNKVRQEIFEMKVVFDTKMNESKMDFNNIAISQVEMKSIPRKGNFILKWQKLGVFSVRRAQQAPIVFTLAALNNDANVWKRVFQEEFPRKLSKKAELSDTCHHAMNALKAAAKFKDQPDRNEWIDYYTLNSDSSRIRWSNILLHNTDHESVKEVFCYAEDFPCNVLDAQFLLVRTTEIIAGVAEYKKDVSDQKTRVYRKYPQVETKELEHKLNDYCMTFEEEIFADKLTGFFLEYFKSGNPDPKNIGKAHNTCVVYGKLRSNYELGFPRFPYSYFTSIENMPILKKISHPWSEAIDEKQKQFCHYINKATSWDRWFALRKSYWADEIKKGSAKQVKRLHVFWEPLQEAVEQKVKERAKSFKVRVDGYDGKEVMSTQLDFMYLQIEDTTKSHKEGEHPREVALDSIHSAQNKNMDKIGLLWEAKCRAFVNIGFNTQIFSIRKKALDYMVELFKEVQVRKDKNILAMISKGFVLLLEGAVAQTRTTVDTLDFIRHFMNSMESIIQSKILLQTLRSSFLCNFQLATNSFETYKAEFRGEVNKRLTKSLEKVKSLAKDFMEKLNGSLDTASPLPSISFSLNDVVALEALETALRRDSEDGDSETNCLEKEGLETTELPWNDEQKVSENEDITKEVIDLAAGDLSDPDLLFGLALRVAQYNDYTSSISMYTKINIPKWTGLDEGLELHQDEVTNQMIFGSIKSLHSALDGLNSLHVGM